MRHGWCGLPLLLSLLGCGGDDGPGSETGVLDVYPEVPEPPAGAMVLEFPPTVITAGTDVMQCHFLEPVAEDTYVTAMTSYQGTGGHHLVLFLSIVPEDPGSTRDCTRTDDMVTLVPAVAPLEEQFPAGLAVRIPGGAQLVLQQHTLNTTDRDIRPHDVAHVRTVAADEVDTLAGFFGHSNGDFVLPPDGEETTVEIACGVARDMNVLVAGPHMHEWGARFSATVLPAGGGAERTLIDVPEWRPDYRDEPPMVEFTTVDPFELHEGDTVRTRCTFRNTSGQELSFPTEMCVTFGYVFPVEGSEIWSCDGA